MDLADLTRKRDLTGFSPSPRRSIKGILREFCNIPSLLLHILAPLDPLRSLHILDRKEKTRRRGKEEEEEEEEEEEDIKGILSEYPKSLHVKRPLKSEGGGKWRRGAAGKKLLIK